MADGLGSLVRSGIDGFVRLCAGTVGGGRSSDAIDMT
jgi:hypothetical protein